MTQDFGTREVRGITLRGRPAREPCFKVVDLETDMEEYPGMSDISRRERLHRHMHVEIGAMEIAAQNIVDFPDAPWGLRMELAAQSRDEARHAALVHRRLKELGGKKGDFPVAAFEWGVICIIDNLPGRLAVMNRTFEAGLIDLMGGLAIVWREAGDEETAAMLEGALADEIQHASLGNRWIRLMAKSDPKVLLQVAKAVRDFGKACMELQPEDGEVDAVGTVLGPRVPLAVNVEGRLEAGFTEDEVMEILRQAGFRSIIPHPLVDRARK